MLRRRCVVVCLLGIPVFSLAAARLVPGQEGPGKDTVVDSLDARVRPFLEAVSQGGTQKAYDDLLRGSPLLLKKAEAVKTLIQQTNELQTRFGRYRNFERIDARQIGKDLVVMKYLYKCEDYPVVWYFTFYRLPAGNETPAEESGWRVIVVRFDTELELLTLTTAPSS